MMHINKYPEMKEKIRNTNILDIRAKLIISSTGQSNTDTLLDFDQG